MCAYSLLVLAELGDLDSFVLHLLKQALQLWLQLLRSLSARDLLNLTHQLLVLTMGKLIN